MRETRRCSGLYKRDITGHVIKMLPYMHIGTNRIHDPCSSASDLGIKERIYTGSHIFRDATTILRLFCQQSRQRTKSPFMLRELRHTQAFLQDRLDRQMNRCIYIYVQIRIYYMYKLMITPLGLQSTDSEEILRPSGSFLPARRRQAPCFQQRCKIFPDCTDALDQPVARCPRHPGAARCVAAQRTWTSERPHAYTYKAYLISLSVGNVSN